MGPGDSETLICLEMTGIWVIVHSNFYSAQQSAYLLVGSTIEVKVKNQDSPGILAGEIIDPENIWVQGFLCHLQHSHCYSR